MLNPYFLHGSKSEQGLIQDLVNEQLRMFGQEIIYMPRQYITDKTVIRDLIVSKFETGIPIEAYLSNSDGFGGQGDILSKFGVRSTDEITLIISKERYELSILPLISKIPSRKGAQRPQEGDLIYFPLDNGLFEIKYVEGKRPFYQLNNLYVYELRCELFEYEDEIIDTGISDVDINIQEFGYIQTLNMIPSNATPAVITVSLASTTNSKSIQYIDILNGGYGFKTTPSIKITPSPSGGMDASAVAIMTSRGSNTSISKVLITNPGVGYTVPPLITILSSTGSGFIGTAILSSGVLGPTIITSGGVGYSTIPSIYISPSPTGQNAQATAVLNSTGIVTSIRYSNCGAGYTISPNITITSPIGISTGTYTFNEVVTGSKTGTSAYVKEWNSNTKVLKISIIDGNFVIGETLVGVGGSYTIYSIQKDDIYDTYAENDQIEIEADNVIDFSERNPFGEL